MGGISFDTIVFAAVACMLIVVIILMATMAAQLKAMRHEAEATRNQLMKMDTSQLLFSGVQYMKEAVKALDTIDKRLQKLEALEKVQISHINLRAGT
jgi:hypothetical protein